MSGEHEADPRFVQFLEWQLHTELRRADSLGAETPRPARRKGVPMIATLALMMLSVFAGVAGAISVVQEEDETRRQLMIIKAEIHLEQATYRLELAAERLDQITKLYERNFVSDAEIDTERQQVRRAEAEVRRQELNLRETRVTGRAPDDGLAAPLVDGFDYVTARLELELEPLRLEVERRARVFEQTKLLAESGYVSSQEVEVDRLDLERAEAALRIVEGRLPLRRNFVAGRVSAEAVELQAMIDQATSDLRDSKLQIEVTERFHQRVSSQFDRGGVTRSELREAEAAVRAAEARLRLAEVEVRIIRRQLELLEAGGPGGTKRP